MKTLSLLRARLAILCTVLLVAFGGAASAVTYTVATTIDFPITTVNLANGALLTGPNTGAITLRSAVIAANMSGVGPHIINVPAGTYNLSQQNPNTPATTATVNNPDLQVGSDGSTITIIGTGAMPMIVQTNQVNTYYATTGNDVITTGFKGDLSPAIVNLTLNNLEITGGGLTGIFTGADDGMNRSTTTITNCNIHDNTNADPFVGQGGAIFNQTGSLSISGTTFANNSAANAATAQGGAIYYNLPNVVGAGSTGTFSVTNCTFTSNSSAIGAGFPGGGAIFIAIASADALGGAVTITGCTFDSNTATAGGDGGAIAVANSPARTVNITKNNFISNQVTNAAGRGGAIDVNGGTTNINFNRFLTNSATTAVNGKTIHHVIGNLDPVNANDNWWLSNTGPAVNDITGAAVTAANWLQLKLASSPASMGTGGSSTLTASFLSDSANNAISAANLTQLVGRTVTFGGGALGSIATPQPSIQASGTATATFNAGGVTGVSTTSAQVEGVTATAAVVINAPPSIAAVFSPLSIPVGGTSTLTYTITNSNTAALTGVAFSVTLPAGLVVATPNGLVDNTGGTATAVAGTTSITLTGGAVPASTNRTVVVKVTGNVSGSYAVVSGAVSAANAGTGNTATANLAVLLPPIFSISFSPPQVSVGGTSVLTFTLQNPAANTAALTGVAFTDSLPAGVVVATPNGLVNATIGGTVTAVAGSSSITLSGGAVGVGATGTISVNVTPTMQGTFVNTTGSVTSTNGGTGSTATATLSTNQPPVAGPVTIQRYPSQPVKISVAQLFTLGAVSDPDAGDTVSLQGVTNGANGTAQIASGYVFYTPNPGFLLGDSFTYTVVDNHGAASAPATVTVGIITDNAPTNNITKFSKAPGGPAEIDFAGIPGFTYGVQYKLNLGDPVWLNIGTSTMNAFGAAHFTDNDPVRKAAAAGFYRFVYPVPVPP